MYFYQNKKGELWESRYKFGLFRATCSFKEFYEINKNNAYVITNLTEDTI